MQRSGATTTPSIQTSFPAPFSSSFFSSSSRDKSGNSPSSPVKSRPGTSSGPGGEQGAGAAAANTYASGSPQRERNVLHKDRNRRPSFGRKPSFGSTSLSPSKSKRGKHRANSSLSASSKVPNGFAGTNQVSVATQNSSSSSIPPLPDFATLAKLSSQAAATSELSPTSIDNSHYSKMLARTNTGSTNAYIPVNAGLAPGAVVATGPAGMQQQQSTELGLVHAHIHDTANKRISTLDYLRKAHEGRIYWFNTLLFDKPDLQRMAYFSDSRKLARRATNYLLLGLSLPAVIDLNSGTPVEFLRSLNTLLTEFDSFQQLHSENGTSSSSLSRARLPHMFRRATNTGTKGRRSSGATANTNTSDEVGYPLEPVDSNDNPGGTVGTAAIMNFAAAETDLLPGEEYTHLLTPSLPFDPDFFETFATLCDVLIDTYTRLLALVPTSRECNGVVGELFAKADSKVRKIIIQGAVKEFEDTGRAGIKAEVANVGKVVLGGLM